MCGINVLRLLPLASVLGVVAQDDNLKLVCVE